MRAVFLLALGAFSTRVSGIGGDAHDARLHPRHGHWKEGRAVALGMAQGHQELEKRVASTTPTATTASSTAASSTSATPSSTCSSPSSTISAFATPSPALAARSACASSYTPLTMITGTGTLPKPTSFVKWSGRSQFLTLDGTPFRVVGPK